MKLGVFSHVALLAVTASGSCFAQESAPEKVALVITAAAENESIGSLTVPKKAPTKPYLNMAMAQRVLDGAIAYAKKVGAPGGSIAIVDDGGHLILLHRMDGTMPATRPRTLREPI